MVKVPICRATEISIHAPPRGATIPLWTFRRGAAHFNSRPSARGDGKSGGRGRPKKDFNSRPSARGDLFILAAVAFARYFNSRPSARGDKELSQRTGIRQISIHAPPRGATLSVLQRRDALGDFNSRPSARGDTARIPRHNGDDDFNSRPSARGDGNASRRSLWAAMDFNSRPSARGDRGYSDRGANVQGFQFTPLREGRPASMMISRRWVYFNSRPSARGDAIKKSTSDKLAISIHAPPRGATADADVVFQRFHEFQFTPLREGRQSSAANPTNKQRFQFTPLREGRRCWLRHPTNQEIFQFTPLREGRQQKICNFCKSFVQPLQISMA